jgi:hypothetical protein
MDARLTLGNLAAFAVDRDKDGSLSASASNAGSFFLPRQPSGLPDWPFLKRVRSDGRPSDLVIFLGIRHIGIPSL